MKLPRRRFLYLAAGVAVLPAVSRIARAQAYPTRPVRIIVGFAAGGASEIIARLMGQLLSERLGQQFIVDNRPGPSGNVGAEAVTRAPADGYTLHVFGPEATINGTFYDKLNFKFIRDIAPIATIAQEPGVMVLNPSVPAKPVPEFIAYANNNLGKINMASGGIGTLSHVLGEEFKLATGVKMVHVPYCGDGQARIDLIARQVQVEFASTSPTIGYIRAGTLRALTVTTATHSEALPDVPAVGEFLPGYEATFWRGTGAPKNTSVEIIDKLNREIIAVLADPSFKARLADLGFVSIPMTPVEFGKLIAEEAEKWGKVIRATNIKPE
jgi:tripartite-type tricarboxylate transporter receptor subunit TctC